MKKNLNKSRAKNSKEIRWRTYTTRESKYSLENERQKLDAIFHYRKNSTNSV